MTTKSSQSSVYTYLYECLPLSTSSIEIRLLNILPGWDDNVRCTIKIASLYDDPVYEALSYCWGSLINSGTMSVANENGLESCVLAVSTNLEAALRHLRYTHHPRIIWADAICIDQQNENEKTSQLALMREIYASAIEVIVWLDKLDDVSRLAIEHVESLANYTGSTRDELLAYNFSAHRALSSLVGKQWWERVWTVQEVTVGKEPFFICGNTYLAWRTICRAADTLHRLDHLMKRFMDTELYYSLWSVASNNFQAKVDTLSAIRRRYGTQGYLELLRLLYQTSDHKATDPRDKIWSLCGLLSANTQNLILPDYKNKSVDATFKEACAAIIKETGNLDVLSFPYQRLSKLTATINTWIPDFTCSHQGKPNWPIMQPVLNGPFHASGNSIPVAHLTPGSCGLRGFVVDKIQKTIQFALSELDPKDMNKLCHLTMVSCSVPNPSDPRRFLIQREPIWRLLVANIGDDRQYPVPSDYEKMFFRITEDTDRKLSPELVEEHRSFISPYASRLQRVAHGRSLFLTDTGFLVISDSKARKSDIIVILDGGNLPYVLRNLGSAYAILGEAYIPGIMKGEMISLGKVFPHLHFVYPERYFSLI